jgi:hypothetical protein
MEGTPPGVDSTAGDELSGVAMGMSILIFRLADLTEKYTVF